MEGVFSVPASLSEIELLPDGAEELVLARRVSPDGRTRAYVLRALGHGGRPPRAGQRRSWPSTASTSIAG